MAKKRQKRKLTLRQRLRSDAGKELDSLVDEARKACTSVLVAAHVDCKPTDFMKYAAVGGSTLRDQLVTQIANGIERELERIYNSQIELLPEEDTDDDGDQQES